MPLFHTALPKYGGPYQVSTTDLELPVAPQSFGTAKLASSPSTSALSLSTVLFTVFYPTAACSSPVARQSWLDKPVSTSIAGYIRFLNKPVWLLKFPFWVLLGRTTLPALRDAELLVHGGEKETASGNTASSSTTAVGEQEMRQVAKGEGKAWPTIVFSHGLGGTRTTYSQICGELASRGYVCIAIEHRDGTAPSSRIFSANGDGSSTVLQYYKMEDLLFQGSDIEFRKEQLLMRLAEVKETLNVLTRLNEGEGASITASNLRKPDRGSKFSFNNWRGALDLNDDITISGHSFGGATAFQVLRAAKPYPFVRGLCYDPWADPIPGYEPSPSRNDINAPLLVINSEEFTLWPKHYVTIRDIVKGVLKKNSSWLMTLVGSVHLQFSDFPLLLPYLTSKAPGARANPTKATQTFVEASLEFLRGEGTTGRILGIEVVPGDEDGARDGEGKKEGVMQGEVGSVRMHVRPEGKAL